MHTEFDRALGRFLKEVGHILHMTFLSVLMMLIIGGIFTSLLYWCVLVVRLAWTG